MNRAIAALCLCATGICRAGDAPQAWINAVDMNAMERVLFDYTNNVIRSEWAGNDKSIGKELPANLGFQFAVVGDEDVTNRVNAILQATRNAIQPQVRDEIEKCHYLGPTLQWLVRSSRQGVTNSTSYLEVNAREAVFEEADFNLEVLTNKASRLQISDFPAVAVVKPVFKVEPAHASILPAEPGVDYPDILPEQTFATPFGIGVVLRAPEAERYFRYMVANGRRDSETVWHSSVAVPKAPFRYNPTLTPEKGFAEVRIGSHRKYRRIDVMACQKRGETIGPPSYISFYYIPHIKRKYDRRQKVISVEYTHDHKMAPPYDISPIWIPHKWIDEYEYRANDIHGYSREAPITMSFPSRSAEEFTNRGELVLEKDYHGDPMLIQKVRYYVEDGELKYAPCGEGEMVKGFNPRRRGEDKTGWMQ